MHPSGISLTCDTLLFDLDGVLVDSTACVEHTWRQWADRHRLDGDAILHLAHGRRAVETIRHAAPHLDDTQVAAELAAIVAHESHETAGLLEVPGAAELLNTLPTDRWAVVTSGARTVAEHRLRHVGLPLPSVLVSADDVLRGKPDPEGYVTAAARLGVASAGCLVVEDAPAGLAAAHAAGMRALGVTTTNRLADLKEAELIAFTLADVTVHVEQVGGRVVLHVAVAGAGV
jgi:sugar-phosphatase